VLNCLTSLVVILQTVRVAMHLWGHRTGGFFGLDRSVAHPVSVGTVLDIYASTVLSFAAIATAFWLFDRNRHGEHDFYFDFLARTAPDAWAAAVYFFALSAWPGAGTMLPDHWSSVMFTGAYTHYKELLSLVILGVMLGTIQERLKEHRKSHKQYLKSHEGETPVDSKAGGLTVKAKIGRTTRQGYQIMIDGRWFTVDRDQSQAPEGFTTVSEELGAAL
jgi:hypothetical protein